jgi:hypothetical protein
MVGIAAVLVLVAVLASPLGLVGSGAQPAVSSKLSQAPCSEALNSQIFEYALLGGRVSRQGFPFIECIPLRAAATS